MCTCSSGTMKVSGVYLLIGYNGGIWCVLAHSVQWRYLVCTCSSATMEVSDVYLIIGYNGGIWCVLAH